LHVYYTPQEALIIIMCAFMSELSVLSNWVIPVDLLSTARSKSLLLQPVTYIWNRKNYVLFFFLDYADEEEVEGKYHKSLV
jgi:hypothetical protein